MDIFEKDMQIRRDRMERDKRISVRNTILGIAIAFVIALALTIWRNSRQKEAMQNLPDEIRERFDGAPKTGEEGDHLPSPR